MINRSSYRGGERAAISPIRAERWRCMRARHLDAIHAKRRRCSRLVGIKDIRVSADLVTDLEYADLHLSGLTAPAAKAVSALRGFSKTTTAAAAMHEEWCRRTKKRIRTSRNPYRNTIHLYEVSH